MDSHSGLLVIGTLVGVLLGGVLGLLNTLIAKRSEERKHYRELVVTTGLEHWKQTADLRAKMGGVLWPLEAHIFVMGKFFDAMLKEDIEGTQIEAAYEKYERAVDTMETLVKTHTARRQQQQRHG